MQRDTCGPAKLGHLQDPHQGCAVLVFTLTRMEPVDRVMRYYVLGDRPKGRIVPLTGVELVHLGLVDFVIGYGDTREEAEIIRANWERIQNPPP